MPSSSANRRELDAFLPDNISTELALWKQLIFDSDMSAPHEKRHDDPGHDRTRSQAPPPHPQVPHPAPPQIPPETYTYLIHALLSLQSSIYPYGYPSTSAYPAFPPYGYPWPPGTVPIPSGPVAGPSSFHPINLPVPLPPGLALQDASSAQLTPSPGVSSAAASTAQDPEGTEDAVSEDKRRRNTAASARFRVKKKLRALNLERTVADLTGRTEELEREATDLRRENTWLKEIVLLKGRNLAALGSQAPASSNRSDGDEEGDPAASEPEPTSKGKGKDKMN